MLWRRAIGSHTGERNSKSNDGFWPRIDRCGGMDKAGQQLLRGSCRVAAGSLSRDTTGGQTHTSVADAPLLSGSVSISV